MDASRVLRKSLWEWYRHRGRGLRVNRMRGVRGRGAPGDDPLRWTEVAERLSGPSGPSRSKVVRVVPVFVGDEGCGHVGISSARARAGSRRGVLQVPLLGLQRRAEALAEDVVQGSPRPSMLSPYVGRREQAPERIAGELRTLDPVERAEQLPRQDLVSCPTIGATLFPPPAAWPRLEQRRWESRSASRAAAVHQFKCWPQAGIG